MAAGLRNIKIKISGEADMDKAIGNVEGSLKGVDKASRRAGQGLDKAGEAADTMDTRAMGFRDTMTGVQDTMRGVGEIAKGNLFEGFLTLGMGIGDLGSGLYNFVIPAFKAFTLNMISTAVQSVKTTAATVAQKVALVATTVATKAAAVAQAALNLVMRANPIALVITAIAAFVGILVLAWNRSEAFRRIVTAVWRAIWSAIRAVINWITGTLWPTIKTVWNAIAAGVGWVRDRVVGAWNGIKSGISTAATAIADAWNWIKGKIRGAVNGIKGFLAGMWDGIGDAAKAAINVAIDAINWIIRRINNVTGVVGIPAIGEIGRLEKGGPARAGRTYLVGEKGPELLRMGSASGHVTPNDELGGGGPQVIENHIHIGDEVVRVVRTEIRESHRGLRRAVMA